MLPEPVLALLAKIDGIQQLGTRFFQRYIAHRPEVRDRQADSGRLGEEEVAEGNVRQPGEGLQLA